MKVISGQHRGHPRSRLGRSILAQPIDKKGASDKRPHNLTTPLCSKCYIVEHFWESSDVVYEVRHHLKHNTTNTAYAI